MEVVDDEEEINEEKDNNVPKRKIWEKPKKKQNKTRPTKNRQGQKTKVIKKAVIKPGEDSKGKLEEQKKDRKDNNDDMETIGDSENEEPSGSEKGYVRELVFKSILLVVTVFSHESKMIQ